MNIALILAAGVGQRMRNGGLPKQFLNIMGKPIIIYTLEKFDQCDEVDQIVIVCHGSYTTYMDNLLSLYRIRKARNVIIGGCDRQSSLRRGLEAIAAGGGERQDVVIIHDGVRPLVENAAIVENIRIAKQYGCAITVHPVTESVVVSNGECAEREDFKKRSDTYTLTSPQTFRLGEILDAYEQCKEWEDDKLPLLDAAMVYSEMGGKVHLVKEHNTNLKITTPEDVYFLRAILDLEESKYIFGL